MAQYRCLVDKHTGNYCEQIKGELTDWKGLTPGQWAIVEKELIIQVEDYEVDLGYGCKVMASRIDPNLVLFPRTN